MRRDGDDRAVRSIPHSMYEVQYRREIYSTLTLHYIYICLFYSIYTTIYSRVTAYGTQLSGDDRWN